jgi:histone-arginine methyltransferase CARM1
LYVAPVEMNEYLETNLKYWSNYHDLNFEPMMKVYRKFLLEKPIVEHLKKSQLIDDEQIFASLDLLSIKQEDLETFQSYNLKFVSQKSDCNLHGFAFWFDVIFNTDKDIVTLSTSPNEPQTHWKQTIGIKLLFTIMFKFIHKSYVSTSSTIRKAPGLERNDEIK